MTGSGPGAQRGSVTAEFAVVLPVAVALLAGALSTAVVVDAHGRLVLAASAAARALGRGDDAAAARVVARIAPGARVSSTASDGLVCVTAARSDIVGLLLPAVRSARSCAAAGGR